MSPRLVTLLAAAWLTAGLAAAPLAAPPPASGPPSDEAPPPGTSGPPDPAAARVQVDKVCPVAEEDAQRVRKVQAAERARESRRVLAASVADAQRIASRRWEAARALWDRKLSRRARARWRAEMASRTSRVGTDLLPLPLCRAVARREASRCAELKDSGRVLCELLARAYQIRDGAGSCPTSGRMAAACRFFKTHDLDAVRGTPLESHAAAYLRAADALDELCDRARRGEESAEQGAPTCISVAIVSGVRDGLSACPTRQPDDVPRFSRLLSQCRAMVAGQPAGCEPDSTPTRVATVEPLLAARVFPSLQGPRLVVFLASSKRLACAVDVEVDTWEGGSRRVRALGTTGVPPERGEFWGPTPVPADVRPGQDARVVSKTCVPWAF